MGTDSKQQRWLPTGKIVAAIGISNSTLHRWKAAGLLVEGTHYRYGLTLRSPVRWNPESIEKAIKAYRTLPERPIERGEFDVEETGGAASSATFFKR